MQRLAGRPHRARNAEPAAARSNANRKHQKEPERGKPQNITKPDNKRKRRARHGTKNKKRWCTPCRQKKNKQGIDANTTNQSQNAQNKPTNTATTPTMSPRKPQSKGISDLGPYTQYPYPYPVCYPYHICRIYNVLFSSIE